MSNFMDTKGQAGSSRLEKYEFQPGDNRFRIVGDVLRRYVYWVRSPANRAVLLECLSFDRTQEKFLNAETDNVPKFYPYSLDMNGNPKEDPKKAGQFQRNTPSWAYVTTVIDRRDGKLKEMHLKKTMFEDIKKTAGKKNPATGAIFGDPTDADNGYDIVVDKQKTGPAAINVKYVVDPFAPMSFKIALTEEERQAFTDSPPVVERHPRIDAAAQLTLIEEVLSGAYDKKFNKDAGEDTTPDDAAAIAAARSGESVKDI